MTTDVAEDDVATWERDLSGKWRRRRGMSEHARKTPSEAGTPSPPKRWLVPSKR